MTAEGEKEIIREYSMYVEDTGIVTNPLVSVLLWTYNHASYIRQSLDSVLMQETNFAYELVVSDDCSTDGTTEILREYQRTHPSKIRLILSTENLWTRNVITQRLLYQGRGKYIALTHGDDYWTDPKKLQKQVDMLEINPDASACFHDTMLLPSNSGKQHAWITYHKTMFDVQDTIQCVVLCHTSAILLRLDSVIPLPEWIQRVSSGDMVIFFLCGCRGRILRIPEFMSTYRQHQGGVTNKGMHSGRIMHYNRIRLFLYCRQYLGRQASELDWSCFTQHIDGIIGHQGIKSQISNLASAIKESPRLVFHPQLFRLFIRQTISGQP